MAELDRTSPRVEYPCQCHCGRTQFTVKIPSLEKYTVVSCNCSICGQNGLLNVYPLRSDVHWISGQDQLGSYRFNKMERPHYFCTNCGSSIYIDFAELDSEVPGGGNLNEHVAINVRTFKDIDLDQLNIKRFDGRRKMPEKQGD